MGRIITNYIPACYKEGESYTISNNMCMDSSLGFFLGGEADQHDKKMSLGYRSGGYGSCKLGLRFGPTPGGHTSISYDSGGRVVNQYYWNPPIPVGAHILKAYIQFISWGPATVLETINQNCNVKISVQDADNPTYFTDQVDFLTRTRSTPYVPWTISPWQYLGIPQFSPDLSFLLQFIIDRVGYAEGNRIVFFIEDDSSTQNPAAWRDIWASWTSQGSYLPFLYVEYDLVPWGTVPTRRRPWRTFCLPENTDYPGVLITGAASSMTSHTEVSKDGGVFDLCVNAWHEILDANGDPSGVYYLDLTADEMDANVIAIRIVGPGPE